MDRKPYLTLNMVLLSNIILLVLKQVTITNCNTNCETVYSRKNWAREFVFFPLIGACYTVCKNKIQAVFIHLIMACYTVCKILNPLHGV